MQQVAWVQRAFQLPSSNTESDGAMGAFKFLMWDDIRVFFPQGPVVTTSCCDLQFNFSVESTNPQHSRFQDSKHSDRPKDSERTPPHSGTSIYM